MADLPGRQRRRRVRRQAHGRAAALQATAMSDPAAHFGDWQYGIYLRGMGLGERPELPVAWDTLEAAARESSRRLRAATSGAAPGPATRCARTSRRCAPGGSCPGTCGRGAARPLGAGARLHAPRPGRAGAGRSADHRPPGGRAGQRARAAAVGMPYSASTAATHPMESIAQAGGTRWYQLYWPKDDAICESLVRRAEAAGYSALVVTLDTFFLGWRPTDLALGYLPFLRAEGLGQFFSDPVFRPSSSIRRRRTCRRRSGIGSAIVNKVVQWEDLAWLRGITELPIS